MLCESEDDSEVINLTMSKSSLKHESVRDKGREFRNDARLHCEGDLVRNVGKESSGDESCTKVESKESRGTHS